MHQDYESVYIIQNTNFLYIKIYVDTDHPENKKHLLRLEMNATTKCSRKNTQVAILI